MSNTTTEIPAFHKIVNEFEDGRRIEERDEFVLIVVPPAEWEATRKVFQRWLEPIGQIKEADACALLVLAPRVEIRCGDFTNNNYTRPLLKFVALAKRAGEALPHSMRATWEVQPENPVDVWLTFLWHELRPPLGHLEIIGRPINRDIKCSVSWEHPFTGSVVAIQRCGLASTDAGVSHNERQAGAGGATGEADIRMIPPLDTQSRDWITNKTAAKLEGVEARTLAQYRQDGTIAPDKMSGVDPDGRMWRKAGSGNSHPVYYKPSLKTHGNT